MGKSVNVIKATGQIEPFSEDKVISSLIRAGADMDMARRIVEKIKPHLYQNIPTFQIYDGVMRILKKEEKDLAEKYSLKNAIMELGPTGYPFEKFVAAVLNENGYDSETNKMVLGKCVSHEIDIIAKRDEMDKMEKKGKKKKVFMVECKFHNQPGYRTDIKVALYTYARFLDIKDKGFNTPWLVTNTKLTEEVKAYALCVGMKVTSWDFPNGEGLRTLIDKSGLYPITSATNLSKKRIQYFLQKGIVFCRDLKNCPR